MNINNPRFVTSAFSPKDYPEHPLAEFAFVGRSNVGKSSLINRLVNRKKLARTSSQPGRTQSINFFNIDDRFYLVDLPGYGFARVPMSVKKKWGELINHYLYNRTNLAGIVQIVDARHKPTGDDKMMYEWLANTGIPTLIVATKVDKISRGQRKKQEKLIKDTLQMTPEASFLYFSAVSGEGKGGVESFILKAIESR